MATVRMTESLCDEIVENAKRLFAKRVTEAQVYPPEYHDNDALFEAYLDAKPKARATLQGMQELGWTEDANDMRVSLFGQRTRFTFRQARPLYSGWVGYNSSGVCIIKETDSPALMELYNKLQLRTAAIKAIESERDAFVEQVKNIINSASTLKKALSLWPGLWELVPPAARNKYNEVTVRTRGESDDEVVQVNLDSLNAAVVTAKIVEGAI